MNFLHGALLLLAAVCLVTALPQPSIDSLSVPQPPLPQPSLPLPPVPEPPVPQPELSLPSFPELPVHQPDLTLPSVPESPVPQPDLTLPSVPESPVPQPDLTLPSVPESPVPQPDLFLPSLPQSPSSLPNLPQPPPSKKPFPKRPGNCLSRPRVPDAVKVNRLPQIDANLKEVKDVKRGLLDNPLKTGGAAISNAQPSLERKVNRLLAVLKLQGLIQEVGDKFIATSGKEETLAVSKNACKAIGGRIATPMNEVENRAISYYTQKYNRYAYLGLKESPIPGMFQYESGLPVRYSKWRKNEPSGQGKEACVEMYTDGQWNDKSCNQERLTVCEL